MGGCVSAGCVREESKRVMKGYVIMVCEDVL